MRKTATGALLGLAIGDAIGRPTEFQPVERIAADWPDWRGLPLPQRALVTDDTQMRPGLRRAAVPVAHSPGRTRSEC
ncbi:ADP-ribosylglycohydrolase family protein [Kitasatospora sp. NBC_00315]|uniref:ADP-ribosylglycohydrolase family protein n=1 Tax=Kitasatospora sp. NBC_00315 TaxID=2975963 RepID=UPI00352D40DE